MNEFAAFEEQSLFSGAARVQGFSAQEAPDLTAGLRDRSKIEEANLSRVAAAENKKQTNDINRTIQIYDAIAQMGVPLAKEAAETLAKSYLDSQVIKAQNDLRKAKEFGTTPAGTEAYKKLLEQAQQEGRITSEAANKLLKEGAPLEAINYIKGLPRYRQLFATQAYLQEKSVTQKTRWDQFLATDQRMYTDVDGVTQFQAKDIGTNVYRANIVYEAFALKDLTDIGFSQEFNPNPEVVRAFNETVEDTKNNYLAKIRFAKSIDDSEALVSSGIDQFLGDKSMGTLIRAFENSYDPKRNRIRTRSEAIDAAMNALAGFYDSRQLNKDQINEILSQPVPWDPKKRSFNEFYRSRIYGQDGLFAKITAADGRLLKGKQVEKAVNLELFEERFQDEVAALRANGQRLTNADVERIVQFGENELGLTKEDMSFALQHYLTAEEFEDQAIKRKVDTILAAQQYITEKDLQGASPELYQQYAKAGVIRSEKLEDISQRNLGEADQIIKAYVGRNFLLADGTVNTSDPAYVEQSLNAKRAYEQYMLEKQLAGVSQNDAQADVLKQLKDNITAGTYTVKSYFPKPSTQAAIALSSARTKLLDPNFKYTETLLPNSTAYLNQLDQWSRGEADFPDFYRQATFRNKTVSSWELASNQYRLKYGRELKKTAGQRAFENQSASVQRILNFHPTRARLMVAEPNTNFNVGAYDQPFVKAARPTVTINRIDNANHPFFVAIGINEGTRRADGGFNPAYTSHVDPAKKGPAAGQINKGTVSSRDPQFATPEAVDQHWTKRLARVQQKHENILSSYGLVPGTADYNDIMFNILDLEVQAPAAVEDFVKAIPNIIAEAVTPSVIGKYRANAFYVPGTQTLNAPGFNNNYNLLLLDQRRRAGTFTLKRRGV